MKESEWFFSDPQHLRREKEKARQIRQSQWWKNLRARNRCHYCGNTVPARQLSMDHRIPISRGGKSERKNLVPSCKPCNNLKKNMMLDEWEAYLASQDNLHD